MKSLKCKVITFYLLFSTYCLLLTAGCKPPRDNPYDPQSPNYKGERVKGTVTNMVGTPLEGALISTIPVKFTTLTDSSGGFTINLEAGIWKLVASILGYVPETTQVEVALGETKEIDIFLLNGRPIVQSTQVVSCHQDEVWVNDIYWVDVTTEIHDPDGIQDIDSVWVTVDFDTSILATYLSYYKEEIYTARIYGDACPGDELESLIGRPFRIQGMDRKGAMGISSNFYLPRIIYSLPYPVNPTYIDTLSQGTPIDFVWIRIKVIHPIVYQLVVLYPSTMDTTLVKSNIVDTTITVDSLPSSTYLWRVQGEDEFGDISRSRAMTFVVK